MLRQETEHGMDRVPAAADYNSRSSCQGCVWGETGLPGTLLHRHLCCEAVASNRRQWLLPSTAAAGEAAQRNGGAPPFWERPVAISPLAALPSPAMALQIEWVGGQTLFDANVFTDGSGLGGTDALAVRCGFGGAEIDDHGAIVVGCFGPLPGELQTVPGAEVLAVCCLVCDRSINSTARSLHRSPQCLEGPTAWTTLVHGC